MRKKIVLGIAVVLISLFIFTVTRENKVTLYIGIGCQDSIELPLDIAIDGKQVFDGVLTHNPLKYELSTISLGSGFHNVSITSSKLTNKEEMSFFVVYDQHLVIEYFPKCSDEIQPGFSVRNRLRPFYLE